MTKYITKRQCSKYNYETYHRLKKNHKIFYSRLNLNSEASNSTNQIYILGYRSVKFCIWVRVYILQLIMSHCSAASQSADVNDSRQQSNQNNTHYWQIFNNKSTIVDTNFWIYELKLVTGWMNFHQLFFSFSTKFNKILESNGIDWNLFTHIV